YPAAVTEEGGVFDLDPDLSRSVDSVGRRVAQAGPQPELPYEFTVINSSKPMAFALPGGKIAITRGLLVLLENEGQLAAVLGHQVVHAAAKHASRRLMQDTLTRVVVATAAIGATVVGIPAYPLLAMTAQKQSTSQKLVHLRYDEDEEILADRHAMEALRQAGYSAGHSVDALQVLSLRQTELPSQKTRETLFESHPLSRKRMAAARIRAWKLAREGLPVDRTTPGKSPAPVPTDRPGPDRFAAHTAWIRSVHDAYEAYDNGRTAYFAADYDRALFLARQASRGVPREARFHELEGHIHMKKGDYSNAFTSYDQMLALRPENAAAWARRGLARKALGDPRGAAIDFRISLSLGSNAIAERELAIWHSHRLPGREHEPTTQSPPPSQN
ncbi:MAG: M48 family metalloprotease, partial [Myxococcota bacterium]|nr:M48 family metalloprotease [Myxococcota bacterium]